jgi:hypothetical protein
MSALEALDLAGKGMDAFSILFAVHYIFLLSLLVQFFYTTRLSVV